MKKITLSIMAVSMLASVAVASEFAYLYKDPKVMARGGTDVAIGGAGTAVFSNPAGLAAIPAEEGFLVSLLPISVQGSSSFSDFYNDAKDVDENDNAAVADLFKQYAGEVFNVGMSSYSSLSKQSSKGIAWSVGALAGFDGNTVVHSNGNPNGGFMEMQSRAYGGLVVGAAKPFETKYGTVDVGASIKVINQRSYEGPLVFDELDEDSDYFKNKFEQDSTGFGVDLGVRYYPAFIEAPINPVIGLSVLNIGSMNMDDNYGGQPTTVNLGVAIQPEVSKIKSLTVSADYVDLFNANKTRIYNYSADDTLVSYTDYEDGDILKRVRLGVDVELVDHRWFGLGSAVGMYEGAYTAGLSLRLAAFEFNFVTYEEELGTGDVKIPDRRYVLQLNTTW